MNETERQVAGRYRLRERVGRGAMGVVWHGYDEQLHRIVAIKELYVPDDSDPAKAEKAKSRAMREARNAARLEHPNAIRVYDAVEDGGRPWLVMEYLPSRSLAAVIEEQGSLPPKDVALIGWQVAAALATAHRHGILHRDIKPANVLVGEQDVKITDFGISRAADDVTATATGTAVGTPAFFSPEVARGDEAGFPSDVYSLGATLYNAVEGTPPFGAVDNNIALLHKVAGGEYRTPEKAGALTAVLERLLDRDPSKRPSMDEAVTLLAAVADDDSVEPVVLPTPARPEVDPAHPAAYIPVARSTEEDRGERKAGLLVAGGAVVLLLLIGGIGALMLLPKQQSTTANPSSSVATSAPAASAPSPTAAQPPAATAPPSTAPPSTPSSAASSSAPPAAPSAVQGLTDYYNLLPADLNAGWGRLTDNFKAGRRLTFEGYLSFWNQMRDVIATDFQQQGDNVVSATVTYYYKSGQTVTERHTYTLVKQQNGGWMIDHQG